MTGNEQRWDVALTAFGYQIRLVIPTGLSKALQAQGYTRAIVTVNSDGILLKPYIAPVGRRGGSHQEVELPEWSS